MATILLAEDDKNVQLLVSKKLSSHFNVICADNGKKAFDIIVSQNIDLLIADIEMPEMDGFTLLERIRDYGFTNPVIILTANLSFDVKRKGFSRGTDDYMTKPVIYEELIWRINALLRRSNIYSSNIITEENITLDKSTFTIKDGNKEQELPKKEFELLFKLLSYKGQILTKNQLLDDIWGYTSESSEETIKTHISRLRKRITDFKNIKIIAVRGVGYKVEIENEKE